jgi:hypothetical protein
LYIYLFGLISLFTLFNHTFALTYEQCKGHVFNQTYIDYFGDDNIYAGRYDDCIISCDQRIYFKYFCYSELGFKYDIWWAFLFAFSIGLLFYSIHSLRHMIRAESDSKPKLNPQYIIIFTTICISVIKIIWMICTFNGKDPHSIIGGKYLDFLISKFCQCIIFSEIFLLILVWKTLVNTTQNMKKIDNIITKKNYIYTTLFICGLMLCVFPLAIVGVATPFYFTLSNVILCIYLLMLMIGGVLYSFQLTKILNAGIENAKRKNVIINIKLVNNTLCFVGLCIFILFALNTINLFKDPTILLWVYWFNLNFFEFIMYFLIAYNISYSAKLANNDGRRISTLFNNITNKLTSTIPVSNNSSSTKN